jgi:hypothetical protein
MSVACNRSNVVETLARELVKSKADVGLGCLSQCSGEVTCWVTEMFLCFLHCLLIDQLQGPHSPLSDGYVNHDIKLFLLIG